MNFENLFRFRSVLRVVFESSLSKNISESVELTCLYHKLCLTRFCRSNCSEIPVQLF